MNDLGTIFEFDPSGNGTISLEASFDGSSGAYPFAALTQADSGKFYGTADYGGANCDLLTGVMCNGTIFEFDPNASSSAPAPLPLMGAGSAFGWSRKLRRRLRLQQPGGRSLV
jgi:hypothetical protein